MKAKDVHQPQSLGEGIGQEQAKGYHNDVPEKSWLRGGGRGGEDRPTFDRGGLDKSSVPQKARGPRNTASGANMTKSPFSAAHRTYSED